MKTISKNQLTRIKKSFKDEAAALSSVCKKLNITADQLEPCHTDGTYCWNLKEAATQEVEKPNFEVLKATENDYAKAVASAMQHFDTFEGNIKMEETETSFIFSKVR